MYNATPIIAGLLISARLSVTALESFGDGFTKADEDFLRQTQAAVFPVKSSPLSQKLFSSEWESHQRLFAEFFLCDPGCEDADSEVKLNEFFDRFRVSKLHERKKHLVSVPEVILDHLKGVTCLLVQDIVLPRNLRFFDLSGLGPGMQRTENKLQFVGDLLGQAAR